MDKLSEFLRKYPDERDAFGSKVNACEEEHALRILKERMERGESLTEITGITDKYYGDKIASGRIQMSYYIYWTITGKLRHQPLYKGRVNCASCGKWTTDPSGVCLDCRNKIQVALNRVKEANELNKEIYGSYEEEQK